MTRLDPKERLIWLVTGVLFVVVSIAATMSLSFYDVWTGLPASASWLNNNELFILTGSLTVVGALLAWAFYAMGTALQRRALREQRMRRTLETLYRGTLHALTSALDTRPGESHGHSRRVVGYAFALGERLGLDARQLQDLTWGALLHDVGKIGVREDLLRKDEPLTPEEWAEMTQHVVIGCQMVQHIPFLKRALPVIRHHHERFDGAGYPDQLRGEDIPLLARVFSVADALDAMTSAQTYRPSTLVMAAAHQEIRNGVGAQFCPRVVQALADIPLERLEHIRAESLAPMFDVPALLPLDAGDMDDVEPLHLLDPLTGTRNRVAWEAKVIQMAGTSGIQLGALVFLDMDGLKPANDTYGHKAGDRLLADLGTRLLKTGREVYRFGGDEFVLWYGPGQWNPATAAELHTTVARFTEYWAHMAIAVSASWGAAAATASTRSLSELLEAADRLMYERKAERKATRR